MKIVKQIIDSIEKDAFVDEVRVGAFITCVKSKAVGLSSTFKNLGDQN